jgi:hypothetical protein
MKTFWKLIAALFIICILAAFIFAFLLWSRMPDIVSQHLSKTLGVPVEIGDIHLSLKQITIQSLDISNPRSFRLSHALGVQEIDILAPILNYFHQDIVIDEINMKNVYIGLEFDSPHGTQGNWTVLINNAERSQQASTAASADKTVLIRRLVLTNIQPDLLYRSEGKVRHLPVIPRIELVNITSKGGDLSDQLMNSALGQMIKEIFIKENLKEALDKIFQQIPGGNNNPVNLFKGLFGSAEND